MRLPDKVADHYRSVRDLDCHKHGEERTLADSVEWGIRTKRLQMSPQDAFEFHQSRMSSAMTTDVTGSGARRHCCMTIKKPDATSI